MDCYMLIRPDGTILTTNADTIYVTVAQTERKAKIALLFERWCDNITGFCTDIGEVVLKKISIKDVNWDFECKHIEEAKEYELSDREFIARASKDIKMELDIQKTFIKSEVKKCLKVFLHNLHNFIVATIVLTKGLNTIEEVN